MDRSYVNVRLFAVETVLKRFSKRYKKYFKEDIRKTLDNVYTDKNVPYDKKYVPGNENLRFWNVNIGTVYYTFPNYTFIDIDFMCNDVENAVTMISVLISFLMPEGESYRIYYFSESENDVRYNNCDEPRFGECVRYTVEFYGNEDDYKDDDEDELCLSDYDRMVYSEQYGMICSLNNIFKKHFTMNTKMSEIEESLGCQIIQTYPGLTNEYLTEECPWLKKNLN